MSLFSILATVTLNGEQKTVKHYHGHNFQAWVSNVRFIFSSANRDSSIFRRAVFYDFSLHTIRDNTLFSALIHFFFNSSGRKELSPPLLAMDATQQKKNGTSSWRSLVTLTDSHCVTWGYKNYQNKVHMGLQVINVVNKWSFIRITVFGKCAIASTVKLQFKESI